MKFNIGLDETIRKQISQHLSMILADTYVLYAKTQKYHWNLVDPQFYFCHIFFQKQYEALAKALDEIAERIRMLGENVPGNLRQYIEMTSLKETNDQFNGTQMLRDLLHDHESIIRFLREQISLTSKLGDEGTADLLIKRLQEHEKSAWMIRSHL